MHACRITIRTLLLLLLSLDAGSAAKACEIPDGIFVVTRHDEAGQSSSPAELAQLQYVREGAFFWLYSKDSSKHFVDHFPESDSKLNIRPIDITSRQGADFDDVYLGIYEYHPDSDINLAHLKICFAPMGNPRPRTFSSTSTDQQTLIEMRARRLPQNIISVQQPPVAVVGGLVRFASTYEDPEDRRCFWEYRWAGEHDWHRFSATQPENVRIPPDNRAFPIISDDTPEADQVELEFRPAFFPAHRTNTMTIRSRFSDRAEQHTPPLPDSATSRIQSA